MKWLLDRIHWLAWAALAWVVVAVLFVELAGIPSIYGWPLRVVRIDGFPPPPAWIAIVDALSGVLAVTATAVIALWIHRANSHRLQFRLPTLMGEVFAAAVLANVWRFSFNDYERLTFPAYDTDEAITTTIMVDMTVYMQWFPVWLRPFGPLFRFGVLFGLVCESYVVGWTIAWLARRCLGFARHGRSST